MPWHPFLWTFQTGAKGFSYPACIVQAGFYVKETDMRAPNIYEEARQQGVSVQELARRGGKAAAAKRRKKKEAEERFKQMREEGRAWWLD